MSAAEARLKTFAVFGGSSIGNDPAYAREMREAGRILARMGKEVWTGCTTGLLEAFSEGFLEEGGRLKIFQTEHQPCAFEGAELVTVKTDNHRTIELAKADGWLSGPGSGGSFGETVFCVTWNLDRTYRARPLTPHFLLNVKGIYSPLRDLYNGAVQAGFGTPDTLKLFTLVNNAAEFGNAVHEADFNAPLILNKVSSVAAADPAAEM